MVEAVAVLLAGLYSFTWLRIPEDLFGVDIPLQFLVGSSSLLAVILSILFQTRSKLSELSKTFVGTATFFLSYLIADFIYRWVESQGEFLELYFNPLLFIIDFSKYLACFSAAFAIYYALRRSPMLLETLLKALLFSSSSSIALSYVFLLLYFVGFTTDVEILAKNFPSTGSNFYVGVLEAGPGLPRLAGTSLEPQQFSVVFLAPLLIMLSRRYIRQFWPVAVAGVIALVLSQSKFSLFSLLTVLTYLFIIYKPQRTALALVSLVILPPITYFIATLPTFASTLDEGLDAGAFVERLSNLNRLTYIIFNNFWHGVGPGQYATYLNALIGFELFDYNYIPNLDYLKIFAETGFIGFLLIIFLLWNLMSQFISRYRFSPLEYREQYLALLIGSAVLLISMFFTYQFLQELFWINAAILMFLIDPQTEDAPVVSEEGSDLAIVGSPPDR